jgi:hypothetical protein
MMCHPVTGHHGARDLDHEPVVAGVMLKRRPERREAPAAIEAEPRDVVRMTTDAMVLSVLLMPTS